MTGDTESCVLCSLNLTATNTSSILRSKEVHLLPRAFILAPVSPDIWAVFLHSYHHAAAGGACFKRLAHNQHII